MSKGAEIHSFRNPQPRPRIRVQGLGERIGVFTTTYARPLHPSSDRTKACLSDQGKLVQLIYDLIDDREELVFKLTRALLGRNGGKIK